MSNIKSCVPGTSNACIKIYCTHCATVSCNRSKLLPVAVELKLCVQLHGKTKELQSPVQWYFDQYSFSRLFSYRIHSLNCPVVLPKGDLISSSKHCASTQHSEACSCQLLSGHQSVCVRACLIGVFAQGLISVDSLSRFDRAPIKLICGQRTHCASPHPPPLLPCMSRKKDTLDGLP